MRAIINSKNFYKVVGFVLALSTISSEAAAYGYYKCDGVAARWPGSFNLFEVAMPMYASPTSFPAGPWREALEKSFERLNANPSKLRVAFKGYGASSTKSGDGVNKIWGNSSEEYWDYWAYAAAHTLLKLDCPDNPGNTISFIKESDIVVNYLSDNIAHWTKSEIAANLGPYEEENASDWNGVPNSWDPPVQGKEAFGSTLLHELGHAAGLRHENRFYSVMGLPQSHLHAVGQYAYPYFGADSAAGLLGLYGNGFVFPDLSVAHFKYDAPWYYLEEYSHHKKTMLFDDGPYGGNPVSSTLAFSEPWWAEYKTYRVDPGETVRVEFTYENLGYLAQKDIPVRFYVSSDNVINSMDTKLGDAKLTVAGGGHFTAKVGIKMPYWLARDKNYWIGVYIDPFNSLVERDENNNTSYLPVHTNE